MTHLVGIHGGDSGGVGGDPPLECGIAVAPGARVTEQARFVQHRERDRIELERVLVGVAVAPVSAIDRELRGALQCVAPALFVAQDRSAEHTSELQSLMRISYAVFCLK